MPSRRYLLEVRWVHISLWRRKIRRNYLGMRERNVVRGKLSSYFPLSAYSPTMRCPRVWFDWTVINSKKTVKILVTFQRRPPWKRTRRKENEIPRITALSFERLNSWSNVKHTFCVGGLKGIEKTEIRENNRLTEFFEEDWKIEKILIVFQESSVRADTQTARRKVVSQTICLFVSLRWKSIDLWPLPWKHNE